MGSWWWMFLDCVGRRRWGAEDVILFPMYDGPFARGRKIGSPFHRGGGYMSRTNPTLHGSTTHWRQLTWDRATRRADSARVRRSRLLRGLHSHYRLARESRSFHNNGFGMIILLLVGRGWLFRSCSGINGTWYRRSDRIIEVLVT